MTIKGLEGSEERRVVFSTTSKLETPALRGDLYTLFMDICPCLFTESNNV